MNTHFRKGLFLAITAFSFLAVFSGVSVQNAISAQISNITYPVAELGSCGSQQECKTYCSISSNYSKCATFAQKNNLTVLIPAVFAAMQKGESPGQCKDEASCRNYCEDI